ncbi:MAG: DegT/DnrJ/EryC1/StrS aminotransferase family protein [Desulfocapsaceae bacterium]|nr:DegT/DnrJ/EryC1/StrS aminotransferase family protein [Desulfocapsaceae bacterium]
MLNTSFSPWPCFTQKEADAITHVLLSNRVNYWTGGEGREFEKEFASWFEAKYAVAIANGTLALELALRVIGIKTGDEVVVTPRTFLASVSSVVNAGAVPIFAEVDPDSQNITAESVRAVLSSRTKAIICVHLAGWPCDMDSIMALAADNELYVIEDCAQAHGAKYKGRSVGSIGHIGCWSFCQDKIMTTGGEGGMVTTNDKNLWSEMWSYKDHGKSWDAVYTKKHPQGFRWLHESFGTNYRMTEMQAAIGRLQLKRMPEWHEARKENARTVLEAARNINGLRVPVPPANIEHAWYKCYVFVVPEKLKMGWNRDRIMQAILDEGVPCYSGSCSEVYLEKAFDGMDCRPPKRLPVAKELGETSLMLLVHPTLKQSEIQRTVEVLSQVMQQAA